MKLNYYIWMDGGVTSVGLLTVNENGKCVIKNPYMVVNMQYAVTEDGTPCNPNDPAAARTKFKVDLVPYLFTEYLGEEPSFIIDDKAKFPHMITDNQESPLVQQYKEITKTL